MDTDNENSFHTVRAAKNGRHGLYDLDPSLINYCNEGLYNLPSVLQLHIFSNAKDVT